MPPAFPPAAVGPSRGSAACGLVGGFGALALSREHIQTVGLRCPLARFAEVLADTQGKWASDEALLAAYKVRLQNCLTMAENGLAGSGRPAMWVSGAGALCGRRPRLLARLPLLPFPPPTPGGVWPEAVGRGSWLTPPSLRTWTSEPRLGASAG